ncbi:hypothetical protein PHJA_000718300 [Phtheirospermum japonicum]|uniref:Transposase (putative) gypsy type domain-containing protein n=1 Tax=Phtheirospermum japonicum TaxID=374723 RepID=A0A830BFN6_9LAMI|nr:hypothetical protein PHJA_000718300 [Phtheirospermum japonicum]
MGQSTLALTRETLALVSRPLPGSVNPCLDKGDLDFFQSTLALTRVTSASSTLALTRVTFALGDLRFGQSTLALTRVTSALGDLRLGRSTLALTRVTFALGDVLFDKSTLALTRVTFALVVAMSENPDEPLDNAPLVDRYRSVGQPKTSMVDPEDVVSTLTYQDVERFKSLSYFPTHWECYVLGPEDGGLSMAPHFSLCLYEDMFRARVRFPLHPSICKIFNFYKVCPAQLAPNAWKVIIGFVTLASSMSLPMSAAIFSKMYKIQRHPGCSGVWYFTSDKTTRLLLECFYGNRNWKSKFFYVIASGGDWAFPIVWSDAVRSPRCPDLNSTEHSTAYALLSHGPISFKALVNERNLIASGLSHRCTPSIDDPSMEMKKSRKFNKDKLAARAIQRQASGPSRRRAPRPLPGGSLAPGFAVLTPTADVGQPSGVPSPITRNEASGSAGSDIPIRFCHSWNVSEDDTITNRVTAIEMMSHVMHLRDVAAATDATFQVLADDRYAILAQQLFTHQGLIAKVNYGSRRVMELATEVAQGEGRVKHLEGEVTDLQGHLASVELEREEFRKENEALKLSAKEVADAAEEAQMDFYLDGFDDCKQMACTYFPVIDFGRLVPCPPASASSAPTTDMETAEGSPSPVDE